MKKVTYLVLSVSLLTSTAVTAQKKPIAQPELDSGSIANQFDYIINKSTSFKEFQLIRKTSILKVKANSLDSLKMAKSSLVEAKSSALQANNTVTQLKAEVADLNVQIETVSKDVDSISFLGMPLSKSAYNSLVWIIIAALLGGLVTFILLFKKGHSVTKTAQQDLEKLTNDFDSFRKKALIKEQETMRKLQDELNKHSM